MIPKKIHYCWFGGNELPTKAKKCINSWKKYCPDYEIIEWNENNFDINMNPYVQWCLQNKKYAFLSDYVRLLVVYNEGGIYFDVDVELVKSVENLRKYPAYFGFETNEYINTGLGFGAEAKNPMIYQMLQEYEPLLDGEHGVIGCPTLNTNALKKNGLVLNGQTQEIAGAIVYSEEYFNPYDDPTGRLRITDNTYSIHWYFKSPHGKVTIFKSKLTRPLHRIFGKDFLRWFRK